MEKTRPKKPAEPIKEKEPREKTPTFLVELPLVTNEGEAKRIRAHLEAGRQLYNAVLSEGNQRLKHMRASKAWQDARAIPQTQKAERRIAFSALRTQYGFSDYALQSVAITLRADWIADHLDAPLAQKLGTRAYQALNRVCLGKARRVRFKSKGHGFSSLENKRNDTGLRFVLQKPEEGKQGFLLWKDDTIEAIIDWDDPVIAHALRHRIKYGRIIQRKASSPQAEGADSQGYRYCVQLSLEGLPHTKRHRTRSATLWWAWTWDHRPLPVCHEKGKLSFLSFARRSRVRPNRFVVCNARWTDREELLTPITTMKKGGSNGGNGCAGKTGKAIKKREHAKRPKNGNWLLTARASMGRWPMLSSLLAIPFTSKKFPTRHGRRISAKAWE